MEWVYAGLVGLVFVLAVFDLWVGVSNDAVNFMNAAIGSRVARFRTVALVAAVGVFCGATMSDGMMDIARHGIMQPAGFSFAEVMIVFLAVMVTDVVLLDFFNNYGMPTSTTVSLVFELLGASTAFAVVKVAADPTHTVGEYLNTDKALTVILAIFLSVALAFVVGAAVQLLARLVFSFDLRTSRRSWKAGIFGGLATTAIAYFMLLKGMRGLRFMEGAPAAFVDAHTGVLLGATLVVCTLLMQLLHAVGVNVLRVVILLGTFGLAMAFAGNDLVNFIGVPLAAYSSFTDYAAHGAGNAWGYMMGSLLEPAHTAPGFLVAAGTIMVAALVFSKKARHVTQTTIDLSRQSEGEELFGSSRVARSLVRWATAAAGQVEAWLPRRAKDFAGRRFAAPAQTVDGAAYDQVRASVNLVVAALLIALGTSLRLPLSTTYVTFMVAMGTSLADRAWGRESAVFRVTGVLTVIGGWFLTAAIAFTACFAVALAMRYGGLAVQALAVVGAVGVLVSSGRRYARKSREKAAGGDVLFYEILACEDPNAVPNMLRRHVAVAAAEQSLRFAVDLVDTTDGLFTETRRQMRHAWNDMRQDKRVLKDLRRREQLCLRRAEPTEAVRLSTDFHLLHNAMRQILYGLERIAQPAREHVENNFPPIASHYASRYRELRGRLVEVMEDSAEALRSGQGVGSDATRETLHRLRADIAAYRHQLLVDVQRPDTNLGTLSLLLHIVQETEQICVEYRALLKHARRFLRRGA